MALTARLAPFLAVFAGALIALAATTTPGVLAGRGWIGLAAVEVILALYAHAFVFAGRRMPTIGLGLGLLAGAIYAFEIGLEYLLTPNDNTAYGLVEFGAVFLLFGVAGFLGVGRAPRFGSGLGAAVTTAMLSALIWYTMLIGVFLLFRGSERQALVLAAEGDIEDFHRATGVSFDQFVIQDFFGAGFYHLLLAPLAAAILGSVGAGLALATAILPKRGQP